MKIISALLAACLGASGCASVMLTGASGGIAYTLTNVAYKTVSYPIGAVENSVHRALQNMGIDELERKGGDAGVEIIAETRELRISVELDIVTPRTTKISVGASKKGLFPLIKDKATATEVIEQTVKSLENSNLNL
ncbi:MAG TPA: DUF3568 family protein [Dissulfurispiraceae bacterium]|nr:DUF3568 family protein [Dissulfurispiraceae bacterium]